MHEPERTAATIRLAELTAAEIRAGGYDNAVLPVGMTGFHGDQLPYSADTIRVEMLAQRFAADLGGMLLLPALDYGASHHHLTFPWTLSLRPETLTAIGCRRMRVSAQAPSARPNDRPA